MPWPEALGVAHLRGWANTAKTLSKLGRGIVQPGSATFWEWCSHRASFARTSPLVLCHWALKITPSAKSRQISAPAVENHYPKKCFQWNPFPGELLTVNISFPYFLLFSSTVILSAQNFHRRRWERWIWVILLLSCCADAASSGGACCCHVGKWF